MAARRPPAWRAESAELWGAEGVATTKQAVTESLSARYTSYYEMKPAEQVHRAPFTDLRYILL